MSLSKVDSFWEWFDKTRGDTPVLEVERLSGGPRGRISNSYRKKQPSALVCQAIARGLSLPEEIVFRAAGLLSNLPPEDATLRELTDYARALTPEQRQAVLRFARFVKSEDEGRRGDPPPEPVDKWTTREAWEELIGSISDVERINLAQFLLQSLRGGDWFALRTPPVRPYPADEAVEDKASVPE